MINDARITFALPKDLLKEIKETSEKRGISQAALIKTACIEYIKKANKK